MWHNLSFSHLAATIITHGFAASLLSMMPKLLLILVSSKSVLLLLFWRHKASKCKQIIIMGGAKIHLKPQHPYLFWDLRRIYSINDILYTTQYKHTHILCTLFSRRSSTSRQSRASRSLKQAIWLDCKNRAFINPF